MLEIVKMVVKVYMAKFKNGRKSVHGVVAKVYI